MSTSNIILQAQKISIGYINKKEQITIASNIDLTLGRGKLIALVGANGIGKSTLLRTITGIQKTISGTVFLNEKNIHEMNALALALSGRCGGLGASGL